MTELRLVQVDAFADRPFTGNPAAVMPLDAWLPDETLQAIAEENNLSETAFTIPAQDDGADYELRWFTPVVEVVLCGHATLASGHVLLGERDRIRFRTRRSGLLEVARDPGSGSGAGGDGYTMSLPAWKAEPKPLPEVLAALGCDARETLWHPGHYALIVLDSEADVLAVRPDFRALAAQGDILTIVTAPGDATDMVSRVFAAGAGIDEDPVTGSAHCISVPFWAERLGKDQLTCFQASRRGGRLTGRLDGDRVILGGKCVTVAEGMMRI
jgi:predicted PhzF superfamily epimerase YddE/YHI9